MAIIEIAKIQVRRGQENQTGIPQLDPGEFGWAQDTQRLYIGKRISEGAVDDKNTRILTENDLDNLFGLLDGNEVASTSTYRYRDGVEHIKSTTSTIGIKLDQTVSLVDFGVVQSFTATDITTTLTETIQTLFFNDLPDSFERKDARRVLKIPAGEYLISESISLPPYTSIEGEGKDLTKLTLISDGISMFKTVDANGKGIESENAEDPELRMASGAFAAKYVSISGMTLEFASTLTSTNSIISLDNVTNAKVEDCKFNTDNTLSNFVPELGTAIVINSTRGNNEANAATICENIEIINCEFSNLNIGIKGVGSVVRPIVNLCKFNDLDRGIVLSTSSGGTSIIRPTNGVFAQNRFENILQEAIYAERGLDNERTNHLSTENYFIQVGNGTNLDDEATTTGTAVIAFLSQGNKSINDYFHRRTVANITTNSNFYYNPLIEGSAAIDDSATYVRTIDSSSELFFAKIPLSNSTQQITIRYNISTQGAGGQGESGLSRVGTLMVNVGSKLDEGYTVITDTHNFSIGLVSGAGLNEIPKSDVEIVGVNAVSLDSTQYSELEQIDLENSEWYLTTNDRQYAKIIRIELLANRYVVTIDSPITFNSVDLTTYSIKFAEVGDAEFDYIDSSISNNYIELRCQNTSPNSAMVLEYQIYIVT